jgi:hypothetical protein
MTTVQTTTDETANITLPILRWQTIVALLLHTAEALSTRDPAEAVKLALTATDILAQLGESPQEGH